MRRMVAFGVVAIAVLFAASLLLLDRMGDDGAPGGPVGSPRVAEPGPEPALEPALTPPPRPLEPAPLPAEVVRQLQAPPTDPTPVPTPSPLPASGAPPAPGYVRESLGSLETLVTGRCGRLVLRLGDQLRKERLGPEGHAVLLLDVEPQEGGAKIWGSTLQSSGTTRQSLVACAQHVLRGHVMPVSHLQPGERVKVQVVVGVKE